MFEIVGVIWTWKWQRLVMITSFAVLKDINWNENFNDFITNVVTL